LITIFLAVSLYPWFLLNKNALMLLSDLARKKLGIETEIQMLKVGDPGSRICGCQKNNRSIPASALTERKILQASLHRVG